MQTDSPKPSSPPIEDVAAAYLWSFETKYYTCSVTVCETSKPVLGNREFADNLEAVILIFSPEQVSRLTIG